MVEAMFQSPIHREALLDSFRPWLVNRHPKVSIPYSSGSPLRPGGPPKTRRRSPSFNPLFIGKPS